MAKGKEISDYKNRIIKDILFNDEDETLSTDIITAIDKDFINDRYGLVYRNIYPYLRIPETQTKTKSYITMSVDMPKVSTKNYFFKDMVITINVIVHEDIMEMPKSFSATRSDYIASLINSIFNQNKNYGNVPLEYVSDVESVILNKYFVRTLRFRCNELNTVRCG